MDSHLPQLHYPRGSFSVRAGPQLMGTLRIARPRFRVRIPCYPESYQASFYPCALLEISDLDEETLGRL